MKLLIIVCIIVFFCLPVIMYKRKREYNVKISGVIGGGLKIMIMIKSWLASNFVIIQTIK